MRFIIQKLVNGRATLRDDQVKRCLDSGQNLEIEMGNQEMIIFSYNIGTLGVLGTTLYMGQFDNITYKLVSFYWNPVEIKRKKSKLELIKEHNKTLEEAEYQKLVKEFRPVFGVTKHIQITDLILEIMQLEKVIAEDLKNNKKNKPRMTLLSRLKKNVVYLIKN